MTIPDRRGQFDISPFFPLEHLGMARGNCGRYNEKPPAYQDFLALWKDADTDTILIEAKQEYENLK